MLSNKPQVLDRSGKYCADCSAEVILLRRWVVGGGPDDYIDAWVCNCGMWMFSPLLIRKPSFPGYSLTIRYSAVTKVVTIYE